MHLLFAGSVIFAAVGWWEAWPTLFLGSVGISILLLTFLHQSETFAANGFFRTAEKAMPITECCLVHKLWSYPESVSWTTKAFRIVAGLLAALSTYITWNHRKSFLQHRYWFVSAAWTLTSIVWLISCIPLFICLVQCAANDRPRRVANLNISERELILRFRKVYSLWFLHDVVVGIFWLYLSLMLYDLADDQDDSEWRTIFLSMLSWHIIIVILYHCYFQSSMSLEPYSTHKDGSRPCCAPSETMYLWTVVRIACFIGIYVIVILRMQHDSLLTMGFHTLLRLVLFSIFVMLAAISKTVVPPKVKRMPVPSAPKDPERSLDF